MVKRYGVVYVDAGDHGEGSFCWYARCIASDGEDLGWAPLRDTRCLSKHAGPR